MLLAQEMAPAAAGGNWFWPLAGIGLAIAAIGIVILFLLLLFRHLRADRQMLHAERMKTLEAGFPLEDSEGAKLRGKFVHNSFWIAFWLVFCVPSAAFSAASVATKEFAGSTAVLILIWMGATLAALAAVGCATGLMIVTRYRKVEVGEPFIAQKWSHSETA